MSSVPEAFEAGGQEEQQVVTKPLSSGLPETGCLRGAGPVKISGFLERLPLSPHHPCVLSVTGVSPSLSPETISAPGLLCGLEATGVSTALTVCGARPSSLLGLLLRLLWREMKWCSHSPDHWLEVCLEGLTEMLTFSPLVGLPSDSLSRKNFDKRYRVNFMMTQTHSSVT